MLSFTPSPFSSVCFLSGFVVKYVYQSLFIIFSTYCNLVIATSCIIFILQCFVAEVRWLFPVISQKYRESTKQWNTEPSWWWELNQNTSLNRLVLRAHQWKIVNIFSAPVLLSLVTFLLHFLLWFVVICVCFPSRTNFPLKVSRRTCRYCFNFYLHYLIITISFIQYVFIDTHVLLELAFFLEEPLQLLITCSCLYTYMVHLGGQKRYRTEISLVLTKAILTIPHNVIWIMIIALFLLMVPFCLFYF